MKEDIVILHRLNNSAVKKRYWAEPSDDFDRGEDGYYNVRNAAWQFLIDNKVEFLPLDMFDLLSRCGCMSIDFTTAKPLFQHIIGSEYFDGSVDCFVIFDGEKKVVVYNETLPQSRLNYSLAHEIGHVVLKHNESRAFRYDAEADMFASRILMPAAVLKACRVSSAEEISALCDVSLAAAERRWERLKLLNDRGKFLTSEAEQKVLAQFADFIRDYLQHNKKK